MAQAPLTISKTKPDFDSILLQLQMFVQAKGSWNDLLTQSTGETLLEAAAAVGAFNQLGVEIAFREAFLTAVRDSSIYAIATMLGVRLSRKAPAQTLAVLTKSPLFTASAIAPMSQFQVNGKNFYNRDAIVFNTDNTATVYLYEGTVTQTTVMGDATPFREISLGKPGFVVADQDVVITTLDNETGEITPWSNLTDGIWMATAGQSVFQDFTDGTGDCVIRFGDGVHGAMPGLGYTIIITYAITSGSTGNMAGSALPVSYGADGGVTGVTKNSISGGSDEKSSAFYSAVAPYIFRSKNRAVTASDYRAQALAFPGVASVTIQAQRDIAPSDLRWMNAIRICVLPTSGDKFTDNEWQQFLNYMKHKAHAAVHLIKADPVKVSINIHITLAITPDAQPNIIAQQVQTNVESLFNKDINCLGRRIAVSDITDACNIPGVDYSEILNPQSDLIPLSALTWFYPENISISTRYTERTFGRTSGGN